MLGSSLSRAFSATLVLFILAFAGFAQDLDDVSVSGKITDSNGQAVVGATVTATSLDTTAERTVVTDDKGAYRIVKLKPGIYKVKASASGFGIQETPEIPTISA